VTKLYGLPVGSGFFTASLGKQISMFYRLANQAGLPMVAFVHNWQVIKPQKATFPNLNYLLKRPHYLPYTWEIRKTFEYLLENFSFEPMKTIKP
jgi:hypothetical protein